MRTVPDRDGWADPRIADNTRYTNYGGAPTKPRFRARRRIADNHTTTHHWRTPTNHVTRLRIAEQPRYTNYGGAPTNALS